MPKKSSYDCVVVGSGPNGLAAAITLARLKRSVVVHEAKDMAGGWLCSQELTLPGFVHDTGPAVFPLAAGSPFFSGISLDRFGLEWIYPPGSVAHPFDDASAVVLYRSIDETLGNLGADARAYERIVRPLCSRWDSLAEDILRPPGMPGHIADVAAFALMAPWPLSLFARCCFKTQKVRALFAGLGAHAILPLTHPFTTAFALVMSITAHNPGWVLPRGGAVSVAHSLQACLRSLGGEILLSSKIASVHDLPAAEKVFFDLTPRQVMGVEGINLPERYRRKLSRYRYGPGAFKIDWALDGPIPWKAKQCTHAGTVHVGGSLHEIELSEKQVWKGIHPERPFVLCVQPSLFDPGRAPDKKHTAWAYCHVPNGSDFDMTGRIERQMERFAPGFGDRILARHVMTPHDLEAFNANCIGGDIAGGAQDWRQLFTRPVVSLDPYAIPAPGMYICSASTPPGGGVHGMCGYNAALSAVKKH